MLNSLRMKVYGTAEHRSRHAKRNLNVFDAPFIAIDDVSPNSQLTVNLCPRSIDDAHEMCELLVACGKKLVDEYKLFQAELSSQSLQEKKNVPHS